jgi:GTPase SAR1 family protein
MKICVVGSAGAGKSSLVARVSSGSFPAPAEFGTAQKFAFDMGPPGIMNISTCEARDLENVPLDNFSAFIFVFDCTRPST